MAPGSQEVSVDIETAGADSKPQLRLWLRMLTCVNLIEAEVRARLRQRFDVTLPRFDLMAQLAKAPDGLTMGELSRRMMVSNGNVTGVVDRLETEGLVIRQPSPIDRRMQYVRLTPQGLGVFAEMGEIHESWVTEMFAGLGRADVVALMELLARTKSSVRAAVSTDADPIDADPTEEEPAR